MTSWDEQIELNTALKKSNTAVCNTSGNTLCSQRLEPHRQGRRYTKPQIIFFM
jgi:hypothetical protein